MECWSMADTIQKVKCCVHKYQFIRQPRHDRSWFLVTKMSAVRYVEENGSPAVLAAKRSAGVTS